VGAEDAEYLEKEFIPEIIAEDLVNLPKYLIYLKLMIDGIAGRPFSAQTLSPFKSTGESQKEKIIEYSRKKYSAPREVVEKQIAEWTGDYIIQKPSNPDIILYDAKCKGCGKEIKVPFKPDGVRPVYCKTCLKKIGEEKKEASPADNSDIPDEKIKTFSLENLLPQKIKRNKKPVSKDNLKKALEEALQDQEDNPEKNIKKGVIKPGEIVKF